MKLKIYERDNDSQAVCCFCGHNIRDGKGGCHCELDGHYIGYVSCFVNWCRHWSHDKKWDKKQGERLAPLFLCRLSLGESRDL